MDSTVGKALALLETLAQRNEPCRLTDLASGLGLTKSNTHRLLRTLEAFGYVRQPAGSTRYEATLRLWQVGVRVLTRLDLCRAARPAMVRLAERSGATVHLSQLAAPEVIYLDRVEGAYVAVDSQVGDRAPAHCTATGKALLAWTSADTVERVIAAGGLQVFTPHTIATPGSLRDSLRRIRDEGFAVQCAEWHPREYAVAAPIFSRGAVIAAVGVSAASPPDLRATIQSLAPTVMEAARLISRGLVGLASGGQGGVVRSTPSRDAPLHPPLGP